MNKNNFDNIKLPSNIDEVIENALNKAEEDKKNNKNKKSHKKIIQSTACGLALCLSLGFGTKVLASNIPAIKNTFKLIQEKISFKGEYSKFATSINQTVYDNGLGVTLSEVLCDGESLYVSYIIKSEKSFKYIDINYENKKREKTQLLDESISKVSFSNKELYSSDPLEGTFLDAYNFVGFQKYNLNEFKEIPNKFEFNIKIKNIISKAMNEKDKDQDFKGEWNFKIPVIVDKSLTKEIIVDNKNDKNIGVEKVSITPFEIKVKTFCKKDAYNVRAFNENGKILNIDSGICSDDGLITIIKRNGETPKKVKVELFKDKLQKEYNNEKIGEKIIYSKDIKIN